VPSTTVVGIRGISARVGAILAGRFATSTRSIAAELGIREVDLRQLIEQRVPPISSAALADLLTAVVRRFGVDPAWLVTGHYDVWTHTVAEELSTDALALRAQIQRLLTAPSSDRPAEIERVEDADRGGTSHHDQTRPPRSSARQPRGDEAAPSEATLGNADSDVRP
jgi:hypothetical protein